MTFAAATRRLALGLGALPWLIWLSAFAYIRITDGWGSFAAAVFITASVVAAAVLTLVGVALIVTMSIKRQCDPALVLGTALAGSLVVYASWER